ncbi:hypothetical protein GF342_02195 [Candidatus Woesearchaeota archaeon]|nr:hypothetical protein [Candidatus Woesearchaeota archaeon]
MQRVTSLALLNSRRGFTDHRWMNAREVKEFECIGGVPEEVAETIRLFETY